jgi:dihydropteroate synthase
MGVVNVTPDSFSDGGRLASLEAAVDHAMGLVSQGADILDVGGESTRPGADPVSKADEIDRVVPLVEAIRARWDGPISVDTMKPAVFRAAHAAGATMWNDVTALTHAPDSLETAVRLGCDVVLMHMKGEPRSMQEAPHYDDVVSEVADFLLERATAAVEAGIDLRRITLDPGLGFGKTAEHNLALLRGLNQLTALRFPVLVGASRKRTIQAIDPTAADPLDRLGGSLALHLFAASRGASIIRAHDVRETVQALKVQAALTNE